MDTVQCFVMEGINIKVASIIVTLTAFDLGSFKMGFRSLDNLYLFNYRNSSLCSRTSYFRKDRCGGA